MDSEPATARVLEVLGSNDLLPFEVVAVRRPIVVTSTRWNRGKSIRGTVKVLKQGIRFRRGALDGLKRNGFARK